MNMVCVNDMLFQFLRSSFVLSSSSGELSELAKQLKDVPDVQVSTAWVKRLNRKGKTLALEGLIEKYVFFSILFPQSNCSHST